MFLNKMDLVKEEYGSELVFDTSLDNAVVKARTHREVFSEIARESGRSAYLFDTNATDTEQMNRLLRMVFANIKQEAQGC